MTTNAVNLGSRVGIVLVPLVVEVVVVVIVVVIE
jgi:hypothetical protein